MTERNPPVWMQAGTYSAESDRLVTGLLVDGNTDTAGVSGGLADGVVPPKDQMRLLPVGTGTGMSIAISTGTCIISAISHNPPGAYICYNQGLYTHTLLPANNQPRFDLIYAEVQDAAAGDSTNAWRFNVLQGAGSPSPVVPATPQGAIPIGRVKVIPSSQNGGTNRITAAQIFDMRHFVSGRGGVHLTWEGTPNPQHSPGRLLYDATNKSLYVSSGAAPWDPLYTVREWRQYFAAYRPSQVLFESRVYVMTNDFISTPRLDSNNVVIGNDINVGDIQTPSGQVKVSLLAYGRVDTDGTSGHLGVAVHADGASIREATTTNGIAFYSKNWARYGGSFVMGNLPVEKNLNFIVAFTRRGDDGLAPASGDTPADTSPARAYFDQVYLTVEPII